MKCCICLFYASKPTHTHTHTELHAHSFTHLQSLLLLGKATLDHINYECLFCDSYMHLYPHQYIYACTKAKPGITIQLASLYFCFQDSHAHKHAPSLPFSLFLSFASPPGSQNIIINIVMRCDYVLISLWWHVCVCMFLPSQLSFTFIGL